MALGLFGAWLPSRNGRAGLVCVQSYDARTGDFRPPDPDCAFLLVRSGSVLVLAFCRVASRFGSDRRNDPADLRAFRQGRDISSIALSCVDAAQFDVVAYVSEVCHGERCCAERRIYHLLDFEI